MRLPLLCALFIFIGISPFARAQASDDGGNAFVDAYVTAQQGEKAELAENYKLALSKFHAAAKALEKISKDYPAWSPPIVKYRKERTAEAIVRVQEKMARFGPGKEAGPDTGSPIEPKLPDKLPDNLNFPTIPGENRVPPETNPPLLTGTPPPRGNSRGKGRGYADKDVSEEIGKVEQKLQDLQQQLLDARQALEKTKEEKSDIAKRLEKTETARKEAERKQGVLETRAALAETALLKAKNDGNASAEQVALIQKEFNDSRKLLKNAQIEAEADAEYRRQLDERYKSQLTRIGTLQKENDDARKQSLSVPKKIEAIQKELDATKKEKEVLALKLKTMETQLSEVSRQRDDAVAEVGKLKDAQKQLDKLVADNAALMVKLSDAQKSVAQFKTEGVEKDKQIADLKKEVTTVKQQLEETKKQSADYQKKMGDLQEKLEATAKQLADVKSENTESAADKKKMQEENRILRDIVLREQRKEADRQAMKKVVLGELSKMEVNSKTLLKQIDFLSEPTLKLTAKERALFKKPELQVTDTEISLAVTKEEPPGGQGSVNSEITVPDEPKPAASKAPKPAAQEPAASTPAPAVAPAPAPASTPAPARASTPAPTVAPQLPKSEPPQSPKSEESKKPMITLSPQATPAPAFDPASAAPLFGAKTPDTLAGAMSKAPPPTETPAQTPDESPQPLVTPETAPNTALTPPVPAEFVPLARQGKEQFERGNYLDAEKAYRKILAKSPRNLYTLSNLGVVLFKSGKFKLAEEMFNKAIAVAPEDGFSHCTLGIVYYQESKLDEAVNELTKALAINPKNPTAHNYLGITASQKGWPEAAQKELETAVNLDASYADAYFNLAVVFATQQPPNKEEARKYYKRAIELGAEADPALEQLIK